MNTKVESIGIEGLMGQTFTNALGRYSSTEWGLPHALDSPETGISCWPYLLVVCMHKQVSSVMLYIHVASSSGKTG